MIYEYTNGSFKITILDDGTKIRMGHGVAPMPETIDLKITDYCDVGCPFCHEKSTKKGVHANTSFITRLIKESVNIEWAIGGGNPLDHPDLLRILSSCAIANLTINAKSIESVTSSHIERVAQFIKAFGVSMPPNKPIQENTTKVLSLPNTVVHLIAGVHEPDLAKRFNKVLILGFKDFGFGAKFLNSDVIRNIRSWRARIAGIIFNHKGLVAFDNLAIEQLRLKEQIAPEEWNNIYMGDDGQFSMYIDAVRQEFAKTSTSRRYPCDSLSIREMFEVIRNAT